MISIEMLHSLNEIDMENDHIKIVFMRGLPGCGKSEMIHEFVDGHEDLLEDMKVNIKVISDIEFDLKNEDFEDDGKKLEHYSHNKYFNDFKESLKDSKFIIIDNSNIDPKDLDQYFSLIKKQKSKVKVHMIDLFDNGHDNQELAIRNQHGHNVDDIENLRSQYRPLTEDDLQKKVA